MPLREEDSPTCRSATAVSPIDCDDVHRQQPDRHPRAASWMGTAVLLVLIFSTAIVDSRYAALIRGSDFPDFYCAARMLLDGQGHHLYDATLQRQYQSQYSGRVGTLYIHPPFEAIAYLAVAWLRLRWAYLAWSLLNLALFAAGIHRLTRAALSRWHWQPVLAASLIFAPLLICLLQGQDSILLLVLEIFAFLSLRRDRAFVAGCWLALGLFKFQLVLPLVLVLIFTAPRAGRVALVKGFSIVAIALAGLSAAISGWPSITAYPSFLLHLRGEPFAGVAPNAMANFRGLAYLSFRSDVSMWAIAMVVIISSATLVKTLADRKHTRPQVDRPVAATLNLRFDLDFSAAILFSMLVSYHLNPHDLALLLLPIFLLLYRMVDRTSLPGSSDSYPNAPAGEVNTSGKENRFGLWTAAFRSHKNLTILIAILFLPPLHVLALQSGLYALVAIPIFLLFLSTLSGRRKASLHIDQNQCEN